MGEDLNEFYRLKTTLKRGLPLTVEERGRFRALGRAWKQHYRSLRDAKGIKGIERDLKLLDKLSARRWLPQAKVEVDVLR